jgi:hypothetical protein
VYHTSGEVAPTHAPGTPAVGLAPTSVPEIEAQLVADEDVNNVELPQLSLLLHGSVMQILKFQSVAPPKGALVPFVKTRMW